MRIVSITSNAIQIVKIVIPFHRIPHLSSQSSPIGDGPVKFRMGSMVEPWFGTEPGPEPWAFDRTEPEP